MKIKKSGFFIGLNICIFSLIRFFFLVINQPIIKVFSVPMEYPQFILFFATMVFIIIIIFVYFLREGFEEDITSEGGIAIILCGLSFYLMDYFFYLLFISGSFYFNINYLLELILHTIYSIIFISIGIYYYFKKRGKEKTIV